MEDGLPSAHAVCVVRSRTINHVQHQPASDTLVLHSGISVAQ